MTLGKMQLPEGIAAAMAIYGHQYNPLLTLQALSYFDDLSEPLRENVRTDLLAAVSSVSLQHLAAHAASQKIGESVAGT